MLSLSLLLLLAQLPRSFAQGHFMHGEPRAFGIDRYKHKQIFRPRKPGPEPNPRPHGKRATKANTSGQCGVGYGSCATGYCCSSSGWCGQETQYCAAPDCQINYGPACDANVAPTGPNTTAVARSQTNPSIMYGGGGVYKCTVSQHCNINR
jgi:hypothetical protein